MMKSLGLKNPQSVVELGSDEFMLDTVDSTYIEQYSTVQTRACYERSVHTATVSFFRAQMRPQL